MRGFDYLYIKSVIAYICYPFILSILVPIRDFTKKDSPFQWIDITGPTELELLDVAEKYNIHRYSIRDCMESDHLPKHESLEEFQFIIARVLIEQSYETSHTIQELTSKVIMFYSEDCLITIHRLPLDFIEEIRTKYFDQKKDVNTSEVAVRVLWYTIKSYEHPAIHLMKTIDLFEEQIFLKNVSPVLMKQLYYVKRKTHVCLKLLTMTGPIITSIHSRDEVALNDLKDMQTKLQSYYSQNLEDVNSLLSFYISLSSQKTNDVMKILTLFSAFFLPLTFLVGVYGMNFDYLPELRYKMGYPLFWLVSIIITLTIYQWFKRKKWL